MLADDTAVLLNIFYAANISVREFCTQYGVSPRKLERIFNCFVGVPPKQFFRLSRFQIVLNRLLERPQLSLTDFAHEFEYFDQTHFIKDFKAFTGSPPSKFLKEKRSIKQIMDIL